MTIISAEQERRQQRLAHTKAALAAAAKSTRRGWLHTDRGQYVIDSTEGGDECRTETGHREHEDAVAHMINWLADDVSLTISSLDLTKTRLAKQAREIVEAHRA